MWIEILYKYNNGTTDIYTKDEPVGYEFQQMYKVIPSFNATLLVDGEPRDGEIIVDALEDVVEVFHEVQYNYDAVLLGLDMEKLYMLLDEVNNTSASLSDADAPAHLYFFKVWDISVDYTTGDRVRYGEKIYKCLQSHKSQSDWTPDVAVSLWVEISTEEWPEWKQPVGAQDAYNAGDKVSHNEKHWISQVNGNVWEPGVYGWNEA